MRYEGEGEDRRCARYFADPAGDLEYIIDFENKKQATDPAQNVVTTDVLDSNLDPSTLEILTVSHPGSFSMEMDIVGTSVTVTFIFTDINLPPNENPPEGEGFVHFRIGLKAGLPVGTEVRNSASIVFDSNPPIETDEIVHVIGQRVWLPVVFKSAGTATRRH